jgi:hypothetical protein
MIFCRRLSALTWFGKSFRTSISNILTRKRPSATSHRSYVCSAAILHAVRARCCGLSLRSFDDSADHRLNADIVAPIFAFRDTNDEIIQVKKATVKDILGGFGVLLQGWAIDWRNFFALADAGTPKAGRVQPAYKIDTSLVNLLVHLPGFDQDPPATLASRNLIRGVNLRLHSRQHVAHAMSIVPVKDEELMVGKATEDDKGDRKPLASLSRGFYKRVPLWFYVLAEAMQPFVAKPDDKMPVTLGPAGGRIVAETFAGLLNGDSTSYLCQAPLFRPEPKFAPRGRFALASCFGQWRAEALRRSRKRDQGGN